MKSPEMSISMINRTQELLKYGSAHANTLFLTKQMLLSSDKTFNGIKLHSEAVHWSDDRIQYGAGRYTDCMSTEHQHVTHGDRNFARTSKNKFTVASEMLFNTIKMKVADTLHRKMASIEEENIEDENGYVSSDDSVLSVDKFANLPTYKSEKIFLENGALMYSSKIAQGNFEKKKLSDILHPFLSKIKLSGCFSTTTEK